MSKNKTDLESMKKEVCRGTPENVTETTPKKNSVNVNGRSGKNLKILKTEPAINKKGKNLIQFQMEYNQHQASQALLTQKIIELEKSTKEINEINAQMNLNFENRKNDMIKKYSANSG